MRPLRILLALALLAPFAHAGTERAPDFEDPRDTQKASADILAVWFESTPEGLRWTMKVASIPSVQPSHLYTFRFCLGFGSHSVGLGVDGSGRVVTGIDAQPDRWFETARNDLRSPTIRTGTPAYVSATIPYGGTLGLEEGDRLWCLGSAAAYLDETRRAWIAPADTASAATGASYVVGDSGLVSAAALAAPVLIAATTLAGTVGGAWAFRRARRKRRSPVAQPAPAQEPLQPETPPHQMDLGGRRGRAR